MSNKNIKQAVKTNDGSMAFEAGSWSFSAQGPRRKASSGKLGDILEQLYSEHHYFSALLDQLETETGKLKPGKVPDYPLLLDIVDYLVHYPDQFHHPREDLLFGELLKVDKSFQPDLERLLREHRTLRSYNDKLFAELSRIAEGRRVDRPELQRNLQRYIEGYRKHMDFESRAVFPRAKGTLSTAALAQLSEKTSGIDDPLFGAQLQTRYRRVGRSLQTRIDGFSADLVSREISTIESAIGGVSGMITRAQAVREGLGQVNRAALERNKNTLREHLPRPTGVVTLPVALLRNHRQYLQESLQTLRRTLGDDSTEA
jgi:hemerythrin-like domain-containing protein